MTHRWDFGDGSVSAEASPTHVFASPGPRQFTVRLTSTDAAGAASDAVVIVSVNNTPPDVRITSPREGQEYPLDRQISMAARATITDVEQPGEVLECVWNVALHHDGHVHGEPAVSACETDIVLTPAGCDGHVYFYRVSLTVTDAAGLATTRSVDVRPDCQNDAPRLADDFSPVDRGGSAELDVLDNDWDVDGFVDPATVSIADAPAHGTARVDPVTGFITYQHDGSRSEDDVFTYVVSDDRGAESAEATVSLQARIFPFVSISNPAAGATLTEQRFTLAWSQDFVNAQPAVAVFIGGERVHSQASAVGPASIQLDTPPRGDHEIVVALVDAQGRGDGLSVGTVGVHVVPGPRWDEDFDGVPDLQDVAPLDAFHCRDLDGDTCDDCTGGSDDSNNDGVDLDVDGLCDEGDFNACDGGNGDCDGLTTCTPIPGARLCGACPVGYAGDGETGCNDVDECLAGNGGCHALALCGNSVGSRTCACNPTSVGDGLSCADLNFVVTSRAGLKQAIGDDRYNGAQASMSCVNLDVAPVTYGGVRYDRVRVAPTVEVGLTHGRIGDLVMKLYSPNGSIVPLVSRPGAAEARDKGDDAPRGDASDLVSTHTLTFDDGAPTSAESMGGTVGDGRAVCRDDRACRFAPARGSAAGLDKLARLNGRLAAGRWKLCVGDGAPGTGGTIERVVLRGRLGPAQP